MKVNCVLERKVWEWLNVTMSKLTILKYRLFFFSICFFVTSCSQRPRVTSDVVLEVFDGMTEDELLIKGDRRGGFVSFDLVEVPKLSRSIWI